MMNFKLRLLPLILSILISSIVLFGGWFVYHSMALKNPLSQIVADLEHVEQAEVAFLNEEVIVELQLSQEASLREITHAIKSEGASIIKDRELKIEVTNSSSSELDFWWSTVLFDVAQAMETKRYGDIPKTLEHLKGNLPGLELSAEMDETNVYIHLVHQNQNKFIVLPRTPVQLGVWPNE